MQGGVDLTVDHGTVSIADTGPCSGRRRQVRLDPDQRRGEADGGPIVAGELVGAHRDSAPLLESVEATLHDVAALVSPLLLIAEVDRSARFLAAVRDLIVTFRDRCRDPPIAQPGPVRLRWIPLVRQDAVGTGARPALPGARNADILEHGGHHRGVVDVPAGDHHA